MSVPAGRKKTTKRLRSSPLPEEGRCVESDVPLATPHLLRSSPLPEEGRCLDLLDRYTLKVTVAILAPPGGGALRRCAWR